MASKAKKHISSFSKSVEDFFETSFLLIPNNQRDYSWTKNEKNKLWDDLINTVIDSKKNPSKPLGHFLGAVVVIGETDQPDEDERWEVIDGQQRLTTITLLARSLLDVAHQIDDRKLRDRTIRRLEDLFQEGKTEDVRVILNREPDFYRESLLLDGRQSRQDYWDTYDRLTDVQEKIVEAFHIFYERIDEHFDDYEIGTSDFDEAFEDIVDGLCELFYVLLVRVDTNELAYKVFETLNQRGLKLSQADLIKNALLNKASDDEEKDEINEIWNELIDVYESQTEKRLDVTEYIQFSWSSRFEQLKKNDSFKVISNTLDGGEPSIGVIIKVLEDAKLWNEFLTGNDMVWNDETSEFQQALLDPLWKKHCVPLVISSMRRFREDVTSLNEMLALIENFLFREGVIGSLSAGRLQEVFNKSALILDGDGDIEEVRVYFNNESKDKTFRNNFEVVELKNKQSFYCLRKIEKYLLKGKPSEEYEIVPRLQSYNTHLEHIMPKRPDESWGVIEEDALFDNYLSRLGNHLILSRSINSAVSNKSISYKVSEADPCYENSDFQVTKDFLDNYSEWMQDGNWTFESIEMRQKYLAKTYALKVWSFDSL